MIAPGGTHGGDLQRIAREYEVAADRLLDFSANINPAGLPARAAERLIREARDPSALLTYPDPEHRQLRSAICRVIGVAAETIVVGPGAAAIVHAVFSALRPRRCIIPAPAFCEYERAALLCGAEVVFVPRTPPRFKMDTIFLDQVGPGDLVVLNNPHNPSGFCSAKEEIADVIARLTSNGGTALVDEAFVDYAPRAAITDEAPRMGGTVAVRSLTKFYGCPALRVGYAVAEPALARRISEVLPPWSVSTIASVTLAEAVDDHAYADETLSNNAAARAELTSELEALGIEVLPSSTNFLLLRTPDGMNAGHVRSRLIREHGLVVRECSSFGLDGDKYLRVAVRRSDENRILTQALATIRNSVMRTS